MLAGHGAAAGGLTQVLARDPKRPEAGTLTLFFAPDPLRLTHWIMTDEAGGQTIVEIGPMQTGMKLGNALFSIVFETQRRMGE
jgi:hypothetical protein